MVDIDDKEQLIFQHFAHLLTYPLAGVSDAAATCEALLTPDHARAAACLREFRKGVTGNSISRLQEIYTVTFDLDALCHPYVGHHLFGESYKRSAFMLGLKERYQKVGLATGSEVADHVALLLRFLSLCDETGERDALVQDALIPALHEMVKEKDEVETEGEKLVAGRVEKPRVYQAVLEALLHVLLSLQEPQTLSEGIPVP